MQVDDKDLRTAVHFMISIATIFEEMTRDLARNPSINVDWKIYKQKMLKYEPTYEGMLEDFLDCVFGEYSNRATNK